MIKSDMEDIRRTLYIDTKGICPCIHGKTWRQEKWLQKDTGAHMFSVCDYTIAQKKYKLKKQLRFSMLHFFCTITVGP